MSKIDLLDRLDEIRAYRASGMKVKDIAAVYGVSLRQMQGIVYRNKILADPETVKRNRADGMRSVMADPETMQKKMRTYSTDEFKRKKGATMRGHWSNPEYYEKRRQHMIERMSNEEGRAFLAEIGSLGGLSSRNKRHAKRDLERRLAEMTPFERQLELVRLGRAKVVYNTMRRAQ